MGPLPNFGRMSASHFDSRRPTLTSLTSARTRAQHTTRSSSTTDRTVLGKMTLGIRAHFC